MVFDIRKTNINGVLELIPNVLHDERGYFVKTFHEEIFKENNLALEFGEEYHTFSTHGVLRGLHFQVPPKNHTKIVYCAEGEVFDVVVDLRKGSETYGQFETFTLGSRKNNIIYIPSGIAHGFCVTGNHALMMYKTTSVYSAECDSGIAWDSLEIPWPVQNPIISNRDSSFPTFSDFNSPFIFKEIYDEGK